MTAGAVREQNRLSFFSDGTLCGRESTLTRFYFLFQRCSVEGSPEDQVRSTSSSVCSCLRHTAGESLHPSCQLTEDCVSGRGEGGGANPLDASHFFSTWICQTVLASFCSSRRCRVSSSLHSEEMCRWCVNITRLAHTRGHPHACLLSCSVQVHPDGVQRSESGLILGLDTELEFR